jgi:hypothetical protein
MKFTWMKWSALPAAVLLTGSVVLAQDQPAPSPQPAPQAQSTSPSTPATPAATPAPAAKPKPTIAQRKENQQDRIANGVKSGQLTAGETSKLETKEAAINGETKADRAANGGKLTSAEKAQINKQQNQVSKQIYADKHNANTAHYGNNKVGQRRENQQDRIAQGIKSGQLTAGETAKLEKKQVNKEQNAASKNIYNKKHNAKTQPQAKPKP